MTYRMSMYVLVFNLVSIVLLSTEFVLLTVTCFLGGGLFSVREKGEASLNG